jgi:hypothetical protein
MPRRRNRGCPRVVFKKSAYFSGKINRLSSRGLLHSHARDDETSLRFVRKIEYFVNLTAVATRITTRSVAFFYAITQYDYFSII